ncbi:MAG: response regulator receiver protein [Ferruginibacter sp.]|uniref:response regulator n=1 Tax=Ferruginibacter sp. TaxID=1940288 RepID=UPI002659635B|nr:response regulator [Ferruginibacter sp.]MDB5279932.1 response regulator receiver protein [Ferruginibacter sp.]
MTTPLHILLVEDNAGDILLTQVAFEELGIHFKMSVVNDGDEAVDFLSREGDYRQVELPHLLLLDINLPKKNGHEVLKYIEANQSLCHIPVIMLTTSSSKKDIDLAYDHHASGFITKPSNVNDFISAIGTTIGVWLPKINPAG